MSTAQGEALVMPTSYVVMNQEEMEYLEGGGVLIVDMREKFLKRAKCLESAETYIMFLDGMTKLEIAQELFAHAVVYYGIVAVNNLGIDASILRDLKNSANPINLEDGGDNRLGFKQAFSLIWYSLWYM